VKKLLACVVAVACGVLVQAAFAADAACKEPACCEKNPSLGKVRHVVLFKFKDSAKPEDVKKVEEAFRGLPKKIPAIESFEWGTNMSPENLAQGFTHCFFLTFKDAKARDEYLPHPDHKAFGKVLRPVLDKVLVVDYVAKE
jgi:hypothetical protein